MRHKRTQITRYTWTDKAFFWKWSTTNIKLMQEQHIAERKHCSHKCRLMHLPSVQNSSASRNTNSEVQNRHIDNNLLLVLYQKYMHPQFTAGKAVWPWEK